MYFLLRIFFYLLIYAKILYSNDSKIFIVARGTVSKTGRIAKEFNLKDTVITHVGIGIMKNGLLHVYHVQDEKNGNGSSFFFQSLDQFINVKDIRYVGVWEATINYKQLRQIIYLCDSYSYKKIIFNYKFRPSSSDTLYCSQFCVRILSTLKDHGFEFNTISKNIKSPLQRSFFEDSIITYYPADFFITNPLFTKVKEWRF